MYINNKKKITQKKQQIIQSLKVGRHIFWRNCFFGLDAAALALHGNPVFCRSGNKLTNAGIAPSRTEGCAVSYTELATLHHVSSLVEKSHKNTLDFTLTEVEQKEGGG